MMNDGGKFEFFEAVKKGDFETTERTFQEEFANLDHSNGWKALLYACRGGHVDVVDFLIKKGANVEGQDYGQWRPLHVAAFQGHQATVHRLLEAGCMLDEPDSRGWTPLHCACRRGDVDIVTCLIDRGVDIEAQTVDQERPFHLAMKWGHEAVVEVLIDRGCLLEERTRYGDTALDLAIKDNKEECVQMFKEKLKIKDYLQTYGSDKEEDSELWEVLSLAEEGTYNVIRKEKFSSMLYNILKTFADKYKNDILYKMKEASLNDVDTSKIKCLRSAVAILGRLDFSFIREGLPDLLLTYLKDLCVLSLSNDDAKKLSESLLQTLCLTCRCDQGRLDEEAAHVLLKFFVSFTGHEVIRVCSAFVLALEINKDLDLNGYDLNDMIAYLKNIFEHNESFLPETLFTFFQGFRERSDLRKALRKGWKPLLVNFTKNDLLGEGFYGPVFKYSDPKTKRSLAVKEVSMSSDMTMLDKIEEEIEIFRTWPFHDSILRYYGVRMDGSVLKIFMEYMSGGSLNSRLKKDGPLQSSLIVKYTKQILEGLDFLHGRKIVHADLRARNILTETDETIKLCVFGLCKDVCEGKVDETNVKDDMRVYWLAPEVIGGGAISKESNVWSLGATILEMWTGHPPYHHLSSSEASNRILGSPTIHYTAPQYASSTLISFLDSIFKYDPRDRPNTEALLKSSIIRNVELLEYSFNSYEKKDCVGDGAYGSVFKCFDKNTDLYFAVKEVPIYKTKKMNANIKSLENEIMIYKKLESHDRILRYFGYTKDELVMNIFMEYISGGSLKTKIESSYGFSEQLTARYTKQVLQGLDFLHLHNIVHRDIKPANILIDEDDNIKVCDFGISKSLGTQNLEESREPVLEQTLGMNSVVIGTVNYMAPEIVKIEPCTNASDVWSLGVTMFEMLTGKSVFEDLEECAVIFRLSKMTKMEYKSTKVSPYMQGFLDGIFAINPLKRSTVQDLLTCDFIARA